MKIATLFLSLALSTAVAQAKGNCKLAERAFQLLDQKAYDRFGEVYAEDIEGKMNNVPVKGLDALKQLVQGWAAAFPDGHHTIGRCLETADGIAYEVRYEGTHTGTMRSPNGDVAATNKKVRIDAVDYVQVKGGKIASLHIYFDQLGFLGQLGLLPPPTASAAQR